MNINDVPDLCLGPLPQIPTAYFSVSLLVLVKIERCSFFVTDFGLFVLIVCHFTEMTSLDQHVLMNMQKVE